MLGEDLDIGLHAEDAYAAYVVQAATELHIVPEFSNARGATVDAVFSGPFMTEAAFIEAASSLLCQSDLASPLLSLNGEKEESSGCHRDHQPCSRWERLARTPPHEGTPRNVVVLHAWIEKLNGPRKVQLTEPVFLFNTAKGVEEGGGDPPGNGDGVKSGNGNGDATSTSHLRVLGSLDFLLHLSTRNPLLAESGAASQDSLSIDKYAAPSSIPAASADGDDATCAARDVLERRDDVAVTRSAVDTVLKFAKLAEEHPGKVATVYVDAAHGEEYLQFES